MMKEVHLVTKFFQSTRIFLQVPWKMLIISSRIAIDAVTKSFFVATQEILVNAQKKTNIKFCGKHIL